MINFSEMNGKLLSQFKENLQILESRQKKLTEDLPKRKRNKLIALIITAVAITAIMVVPGNNESNLLVVEEAALIASIIMWFINWKALNKGNVEMNLLMTEIGKRKIEIIRAEENSLQNI